MKTISTLLTAAVLSTAAYAQNTVDFNAGDNWVGYMNVFELPANGGGYQFGSSWGLPDVKSTPDLVANTLTLQPNFNTYADNTADAYWVDQTTMLGNKDMEGSTFVEPGPTFNGADLTFQGSVLSFDLDTSLYTAQVFIKALDSLNGYADALGGSKIMDIPSSGDFSLTATAAELPSGLIIQYGFTIRGVNANPADEVALGSVVIGIDNTTVGEAVLQNVDVFPVPANDFIYIQSEESNIAYSISNVAGQTVAQGSGQDVNISSLNNGVYLIKVTSGNASVVKRFIKK